MGKVYDLVKQFMKRYPGTIAWRVRAHSKLVERNLNPGEQVYYAFAAQKNDNPVDLVSTSVIALTNQRILIGQKRLLFGYFTYIITPDMFNDLTIDAGIVWGKIKIDTLKEVVTFTNIAKSALPEIEKQITEYMIQEKQKYFVGINK